MVLGRWQSESRSNSKCQRNTQVSVERSKFVIDMAYSYIWLPRSILLAVFGQATLTHGALGIKKRNPSDTPASCSFDLDLLISKTLSPGNICPINLVTSSGPESLPYAAADCFVSLFSSVDTVLWYATYNRKPIFTCTALV